MDKLVLKITVQFVTAKEQPYQTRELTLPIRHVPHAVWSVEQFRAHGSYKELEQQKDVYAVII